MTYALRELIVSATGPSYATIAQGMEFGAAWAKAMEIFEDVGARITGCHLEPEMPGHSARAEFYVVVPGDPPIYETYIIEET